MKLSLSAFLWWFFAILLAASVKLGLDKLWIIDSGNLWGSIVTSGIGFVVGFGVVGFFRKHEAKAIVGGAAK